MYSEGTNYGPPPSATGYRNVVNYPPPTQPARSTAPTGSTPATTYAPPSSPYGAPPSAARSSAGYVHPHPSAGGQTYAPPPSGPLSSLSLPVPPSRPTMSNRPGTNQAVSQTEMLNRLGQTSAQPANWGTVPMSYRQNAPPPISTAGTATPAGLDSRGSVASNRGSGNYTGAYQQYHTGAPVPTTHPRGFGAPPTPSSSTNSLNGPGGSPVSPVSGSRIDPSQMPRPDKPLLDVIFHTKSGSGRRNPPSCNSIYTSVDTGNCIPRHMRCTLVAPPISRAVLDKTGLPFALLATPFADTEHGEKPLPEVDLGPVPPRCTRCRAYVNASVQWGENGNVWTCNLCSMVNDTPAWYYCSLDGAGQRMDRSSRPELSLGSVDFLVNEDYCVRDIQEPVYVFALDISHKAVANGVTVAGIRAIRAALERLRVLESRFRPPPPPSATASAAKAAYVQPTRAGAGRGGSKSSGSEEKGPVKVRAAIVTFDREVQFYTVNMAAVDPVRMYVVGAEDPLCPVPPAQWLLEVSGQESALEHLLQRIPELIVSMQDGAGAADSAPDTPAILAAGAGSGLKSYASFSSNMGGFAGSTGNTPRSGAGATPRGRPLSGAGYDVGNVGPENTPCCVTAAIKAVQEGLDKVGGRLLVMSSSHATVGLGALSRARERVNLYGTKEEIALYGYATSIINGPSLGVKEAAASVLASAATALSATAGSSSSAQASKVAAQLAEQAEDMKRLCGVYRDLALSCTRSYVAVSLLACVGDDCYDGGPFFDTALLGEITTQTGGQFHFFTGALMHEENVTRLEQQLVSDIQDMRASEAVVKLRTSVGLRVDRVLGPGNYNSSENEAELCGMDRHTTLLFNISHDSALKEDERAHFQLAVLHTTPDRRRVIRVHNLSCISTQKPTVVFRNSDIEAVLACLAKDAVDRALTRPLSEEGTGARYFLDNAIANALHKYRVHCSPASPSGQLVLPDSMKIMPVFVLGMLKHPALFENRSALGTVNANTTVCNTQSLMTNSSSSGGGAALGGVGGSSTNLSKLAFIPTYESALSRVAVRAHERAYELRRLLCASLVDVVNSLYPRMYKLSTLFDDMGDLSALASHSTDESTRIHAPGGDASNDSIDVSDEYLNNSTGSVSFNNLLGRHAVGLQLEAPSAVSLGTIQALSASADAAEKFQNQLVAKTLCTLCPSAEVFESDQIYLLDDRSCFYMYVGRAVPRGVVDELLETVPGVGGLGRRECVAFRTDSSELARRMAAFVDVLRDSSANKQELRVVWGELSGNSPLMGKFSNRLIEDGNAGLMSYVDYLCNLHIKIQGKSSGK